MKTPELTVIMPVYNGEAFITEAVDSILNQTFKEFTLIILNDCSLDNTAKILEDLKNKDSRIELIHKTHNVGPAILRNEGIAVAQSEYIALMDADDIALATRFEKQVSFLKNNPDYGICGTWFQVFGNKKEVIKHPVSHNEIKVKMLQNCSIGNPTVMLRKSSLKGLCFEKKYVPAEDYALWSQLIFKTKSYNIPEVLLLYRWHTTNISQSKRDHLDEYVKEIRQKQLLSLDIEANDATMEYYLKSLSLERGLTKDQLIETIKASKKLKSLNTKINFYNNEFFEVHINKCIKRSIRNASEFDMALFKYIKNESGYFQKAPLLDRLNLFFKCLF